MKFLLSKGSNYSKISDIKLKNFDKNKIIIFKNYNNILSEKKKEIDNK